MSSISTSLARSPVLSRPLVIGASGLVGGAFHRRLAAAGADVRGTWRRNERPGLERFSLDEDAAPFLERHAPSLVVLASGLTHVDYCETHPGGTFARNVDEGRPVTTWCPPHNVPLIYLSTDYVFDGKAGPYAENAAPASLSIYGR